MSLRAASTPRTVNRRAQVHGRAARRLRRAGDARGRRGAPVRSRRTCRGAVRRRADARGAVHRAQRVFCSFRGARRRPVRARSAVSFFDREKVDEDLRRTQPAGLSVRRGAHPRRHLCLRQPRRDDSFLLVSPPTPPIPRPASPPLPQSDGCWSICLHSPHPSSTAASRSAPSSARRWAKRPSARRRVCRAVADASRRATTISRGSAAVCSPARRAGPQEPSGVFL